MICSARELNISDEHDGILVLPESCSLGANFVDEYANKFLKIELDITPNRPDAFSHYGVARDISVFKKRTLNPLTFEAKNTNNASTFNISISDQKDCPRYIGAIVNDVKVGPSPTWIQDRLIAAGQRPINNLVDISNYVLMEMGQPTHIFDWDKVSTDEILVRRANKNGFELLFSEYQAFTVLPSPLDLIFNVIPGDLNYKLDFLKNTPLKFIGASNLLAIRKNKWLTISN